MDDCRLAEMSVGDKGSEATAAESVHSPPDVPMRSLLCGTSQRIASTLSEAIVISKASVARLPVSKFSQSSVWLNQRRWGWFVVPA